MMNTGNQLPTSSQNVLSHIEVALKQSFVISSILFYVALAINFVKSFLQVSPDIKKVASAKTNASSLFPQESKINACEAPDIKPCSTHLGTRLVPVKSANGDIEWKFVDDNNSNESNDNNRNTANFNIPSTEFFDEQLAKIHAKKNQEKKQQQQPARAHQQQFSPVSEASSSANDSHIENLKLNNDLLTNTKKVQLASPASSTSNGLSPPITQHDKQAQAQQRNMIDLSPQSSNASHSSLDSVMDQDEEEDEEEEDEDDEGVLNEAGELVSKKNGKKFKKHVCPYCSATFRIRGYLTRHLKKHSSEKAYTCPFFNLQSSHKCHATGGFSRRDTYKTHLKSRHFKYPSGTKSANRTGMNGWCGLCGQSFANNEIWVETHIETGECGGLPSTYHKRDSSKKKTGKRSHLLDAVSADTPPPLDLKKSPLDSNYSFSSTNSPHSPQQHRPQQQQQQQQRQMTATAPTSEEPMFNNIKLESRTEYNTPLSYQQPSSATPQPQLQHPQQQQQQQQQQLQQQPNLEAFYYQPTQYDTVPYTKQTLNPFGFTNSAGSVLDNVKLEDQDDDFAPLDEAFYQIRAHPSAAQSMANPVFDNYRHQFPDFGI